MDIEYQFPAYLQLDDAFLSRMAAILEAEYRAGDFAAEVERFRVEGQVQWGHWSLRGRHGTFRVRVVCDVAHLHCLLKAPAPQVFAGKELMLRQPGTRLDYSLLLSVDDAFLAGMASILEAPYRAGEFDEVFDALYEGEDDECTFTLDGRYGLFRVQFQRHEHGEACQLVAQEPQLSAGKQWMKDRYLARGGDPARLKP